jgi:hypothetical protein
MFLVLLHQKVLQVVLVIPVLHLDSKELQVHRLYLRRPLSEKPHEPTLVDEQGGKSEPL